MDNQFITFLKILTGYSSDNVRLQYVISWVISFLFVFAFKKTIKKYVPVIALENQYIGCSVFVSLIYNIMSPYLFVLVGSYLVSLLLKIFLLSVLLICLSIVEYFILKNFEPNREILKKVVLKQAVAIPIFTFVLNTIIFIIVILISSFS